VAIKKSELYSSLWARRDELRGGMDASQYKDYVLVLLFVKYVSDRYAGKPFAPIAIPAGASFADMVALKGKSDIGDQINKKILGPLAQANKLSDMPDFDDPNKLGSGKVGRHPIPRRCAAHPRSLSEATNSTPQGAYPAWSSFLWRQRQRQSDFSFCVECFSANCLSWRELAILPPRVIR
jgi:hypothetical protein